MSRSPPPIRAGLLCAIIALVAGAALVLAVNVRGRWLPQGRTLEVPASRIHVGRGSGMLLEDILVVTGLDATGTAVLIPRIDPFSAATHPILEWDLEGGEGYELILLWHVEGRPDQVFQDRLARLEGGVRQELGGHADWNGTIRDVALAVRGRGISLLHVRGLRVAAGGIPDVLGHLGRDWFGFEPWRQSSINFWYGGNARPWMWWPVAIAVAFAFAAALLAAWCRIRRLRYACSALGGLLLLGVVVADLPWLATAIRQVGDTWGRYGDADHRRLPPAEADLERARLEIAPRLGEGRVFVFSDVAYVRGRMAYNLLPRQVYGNLRDAALPGRSAFRRGDALVFVARDHVPYDSTLGRLDLDDGSALEVERLVRSEGVVLFRVQ